ncbi:MAG: hypothetical protein H0Z33_13270 [Bacillaceae bacterium]|nr:hypothetical protein [Bacillaceae bacterium]
MMNTLFLLSLVALLIGYVAQLTYPGAVLFVFSATSLVLLVAALYQSLKEDRIRKEHLSTVK